MLNDINLITNQNLFFVEVTMPPRIRKDLAEYLMPSIVSGVQSGMYTRTRGTDVRTTEFPLHMTYALQHRPTDARVKASNTTNLKKSLPARRAAV